jgi:hypothetical protein
MRSCLESAVTVGTKWYRGRTQMLKCVCRKANHMPNCKEGVFYPCYSWSNTVCCLFLWWTSYLFPLLCLCRYFHICTHKYKYFKAIYMM